MHVRLARISRGDRPPASSKATLCRLEGRLTEKVVNPRFWADWSNARTQDTLTVDSEDMQGWFLS